MSRVAWRVLTRAQLREQPLRLLATIAAIMLGVALGSAVYLINTAALSEFDLATRRLIGNADLIVRGSPQGFDESLFVTLARDPSVQIASPVLELELTLPGEHPPLKLLGVDAFRAAALQPLLLGELAGDVTRLFAPDSIVLSHAAAEQLALARGGSVTTLSGERAQRLQIVDVLTDDVYPEALGVMDIASAQWAFGHLGHINRIDLRLRAGVDVEAYRTQLARTLPAGVVVHTPTIERGRAVNATRAYRVNLNMLALVALLTGTFLVFSTQSLAVLRRRAAIGLLRALGVTREELRRALLMEGIAIGIAGAVPGALLGGVLASVALHYLGSSLGNRQLATVGTVLSLQPTGLLAFVLLGTIAAAVGAWLPAREAAGRPPALALKAGDVEPALARVSTGGPALLLLLGGAALAFLPPLHGIPVAGYLSIAALLLGSVLLIPLLMRTLTRVRPRTGHVVVDTATAQLAGSASLATINLACIVVSFSLMVAMAIMVHSFRTSFDLWLVKMLPADLQLRASVAGGTGALSVAQQQRLAALPEVVKLQFRRQLPIWMRPDSPAVTLIARDFDGLPPADALPLIATLHAPWPAAAQPAWISEGFADTYGYRPGDSLSLPLGGQARAFRVAGVWRDYVRSEGAVIIDRDVYIRATGDTTASEGSIWGRPGVSASALEAAVRQALRSSDALELIGSAQLRERSLVLFDRAFAITYALEFIAVLIGLAGVGVAASSSALTRRAQFGMLRHLGMLRRQVLGLLATEGVLMSLIAVVYGLVLGGVLSLILVYVVNRQSFSWSIDLAIPASQLLLLSAALVVASALTAVWSGRAVLSQDAVRAVREDW
jgi:putative ABC transport system permease protein